MKPVKYSVSRKCFHQLSARQRKRIVSEVKNTLRLNAQNSVMPKHPDNASSIHVAASSIHTDSFRIDKVSFTDDIANDNISNIIDTDNIDILSISNDNYDSENSISSSLSSSSIDKTFQDRLATCFINNNLTHVQSNNVLSVLRTHTCFSSLPKDVKTLLKTPRTPAVISQVIDPAKYIHFSLEAEIVKILSHLPSVSVPHELEIDFNTDGCCLDRVGSRKFTSGQSNVDLQMLKIQDQ